MIQQVKEFNYQADLKYRKAVDNYQFGQGGFPFRPMYLFMTEDNEKPRVKGWVVVKENNYKLYPNKELAILNDN